MSTRPIKVSDEKSVRDRDKDLLNREASLDLALRDIMSKPHQRAWVWQLLESAHIFGNPFDIDSSRNTDFMLGEQNVGKQVLAQLTRACPDLYVQAIQEADHDPRR